MAITRLERKVKRNRINAQNRLTKIKHLLRKPVIKNIDIDAIKLSFNKGKEEGSTNEVAGTVSTQA
jgi:hypothetical protein